MTDVTGAEAVAEAVVGAVRVTDGAGTEAAEAVAGAGAEAGVEISLAEVVGVRGEVCFGVEIVDTPSFRGKGTRSASPSCGTTAPEERAAASLVSSDLSCVFGAVGTAGDDKGVLTFVTTEVTRRFFNVFSGFVVSCFLLAPGLTTLVVSCFLLVPASTACLLFEVDAVFEEEPDLLDATLAVVGVVGFVIDFD